MTVGKTLSLFTLLLSSISISYCHPYDTDDIFTINKKKQERSKYENKDIFINVDDSYKPDQNFWRRVRKIIKPHKLSEKIKI